MVTVVFLRLLCVGGGAAAQKLDISSQLSILDVPEGLQQFLAAMVTKMEGLEAELRSRTLVEEELRGEISWLKRDKEAFQNKTRVVEAELRRELEDERRDKAALRIEVMELRGQTSKDLQRINARLDRCEADTFAEVVERRQTQELQTPACGREAVDNMLSVCCGSGVAAGNGHRLQESVGCDSLPSTCSLQCSYQFISIFDSCHDDALMRGLSTEQLADWTSFYAVCSEVEQSAAEMGALQPVNVRMFRIMISSDAAQSQAEMFGNAGQTQPIIGPLPQLPPPPPSASSDSGSTDVEQYHAQCTTSNILSCVPECNATHHGFELLATIDGTDTKFSCNLANQLFSWVGAAALGGFLGQNVAAFVSAVISGAAGTYVLTLMEDADVGTDLVVQPGQSVIISGDVGLEGAPSWGSGGFTIADTAMLTLQHVLIESNHIGSIGADGVLTLRSVQIDVGMLMASLGAGGTLRLRNIPLRNEYSGGILTGNVERTHDRLVFDPDDMWSGFGGFIVLSGPCTTTLNDQNKPCVGRPHGYLPNEDCHIVAPIGGILGRCPVFDISGAVGRLRDNTGPCTSAEQDCIGGTVYDFVEIGSHDAYSGMTLIERLQRGLLQVYSGDQLSSGQCPGMPSDFVDEDPDWHANTTPLTLQPNEHIYWHSDDAQQGGYGCNQHAENCGLPYSDSGRGGGWQICFA